MKKRNRKLQLEIYGAMTRLRMIADEIVALQQIFARAADALKPARKKGEPL